MGQYIGLDVSLKETAISVRQDGKRTWRGKCPSVPKLLADVIRKRAPNVKRVVFETGPLSVWFYHALTAEGLPAICIDARHAKAALDMAPNKTDANDADGLAHLAEVGFYREVRVKQYDSMLTRTLVAARGQLIKVVTELSNQIRGLMKTFGLVVPKGAGRVFEANVRALLADNVGLERIILPLLEAWRSMRDRAAELDRQLVATARESASCQLLMSIPGVGSVVAASFAAAIEAPENFRKSRSVGAWLGLTTRRYQSGEVDFDGQLRLQRPAKDSRTSSKPPSTDKKEKRVNSRPGGAKPGHEPHNRVLADVADEFRDHEPTACKRCSHSFSGVDTMVLTGAYDEIDIPVIRPYVTRHRRYSCHCPRCGTTTQATAPAVATATPFGPGIHALAIYLKSFHALSYERLSGVFKDILQTNLLLVQRAVISI